MDNSANQNYFHINVQPVSGALGAELQVLIFHFRLRRGGGGDSECFSEPSGNFLSKSGHHSTTAAQFC
ncbi:MAG: hypothetical protein CM1200mP30_17820 [Pseudomonadota bacterium]|nr:MAG: hypothetical protein CM1200mP30_17820 [Pseudomonadota bacterium]